MNPPYDQTEQVERNADIKRRRDAGQPYKEIADAYGISETRALEIYKRSGGTNFGSQKVRVYKMIDLGLTADEIAGKTGLTAGYVRQCMRAGT